MPLVRRQGEQARQMRSAISAKDEAMEHLRAFTRSTGTTLRGRPVSPGLAEGFAFVYRGEIEPPRVVAALAEAEIEGQLNRLDQALEACARELDETRARYGEEWPEGAELAEVRLAMVSDLNFAAECRRRIREDRLDARGAVVAEISRLEQGLQSLDQTEGPALPCVTRDGVEVGLLANIAHPDEAVMVLEHGLKGPGRRHDRNAGRRFPHR